MPNNILTQYGLDCKDDQFLKNYSQPKAAWHLIPDDALLEIFSFLSVKDLGRVGKFCSSN